MARQSFLASDVSKNGRTSVDLLLNWSTADCGMSILVLQNRRIKISW